MTFRSREAVERRQSSKSCRSAHFRRRSGTKPLYAPAELPLIRTVSPEAEQRSCSPPSSPSPCRVTKVPLSRPGVSGARTEDCLQLPASGPSAIAQQPFHVGNRGCLEPIPLLSESIPVLRSICPQGPVWIRVERDKWRLQEPH